MNILCQNCWNNFGADDNKKFYLQEAITSRLCVQFGYIYLFPVKHESYCTVPLKLNLKKKDDFAK